MVCLYLVLIRVSGKSSWRSLFPYQEGSFCSKTSWKAQEGGFVQSITSYVSPAVFYTSIPCVIQYYPWIRHTVKLLALWPFTCRSDEWGSRLLMHMANYNFESLYPSYSTCLTLILENILSTFLCWDFFRSPLSVEMSYIELCFCPGQGFQVQAYPHWEQDSSLGPLLQDQKTFASKLEIVCQYFIAIIIFFKIARYSFLGSVKPINK